ncbi:MAG: PilW family protein [Candidatus Methylomirabilales bacterium]
MQREQMRLMARQHQQGYSLLETLVASSIFVIVFFAIYLIYETGHTTYAVQQGQMDIQQNARLALEQMAREIRQAGFLTGDPPPNSYAVIIATNDTLSIHGDLEGTGDQYITYGLRDSNGNLTTTLLRQNSSDTAVPPIFSGGEVLAENVVSLRFTYYTSENVPIPDPPNPPYQLDLQNYVTGTTQPTMPTDTSDRAKISQVKIELTVQRGSTVLPQIYTMTTDVTLRNMK